MNPRNPLLDWDVFPDFPSITADHVIPAMQSVVTRSTSELEMLEKARPRTWHGLLVPLERLSDRVFRTWGLATHLHNVRNNAAMRQAYAQAQPLVVEFSNRMGQSRPVYDALLALRDGPGFSGFSHALQRTILLLLRDATLQGVYLGTEHTSEAHHARRQDPSRRRHRGERRLRGQHHPRRRPSRCSRHPSG